MKNLLKVLVAIAIVSLFSFNEANAQISIGGGVAYATGISNIGISVNGEYAINDDWDAAAGFTYFLKKGYLNWSALDLDAHYNFTEASFGKVYGIAGLNVLFASYKIPTVDLGAFGSYGGNYSSSSVGLNLGIGTKIAMSDKLAIAPEVKYAIGSGYLQIGAKILFGL